MRAALLACALAACAFEHGSLFIAPIEIDFARPTSLQDHASGMVMVPVVISTTSDQPVFFQWSVTGGTAVQGTDYSIVSDPMLAIPAGQTQTVIVLNIPYVTAEGPDTTLDLAIEMPEGAVLGQGAAHEMTISGVILPRVTFSQATSAAPETSDAMVNVQMDKASPVATTVDVLLGGTAVQNLDYTFAGGTVTFAANQATPNQLLINVIHDNENNTNVDLVLTLDNAQKMIIGTPGTFTHTIQEVDPPPSATFSAGAAAAKETAGMVTVNVTLSAPSREIVTVPFAVNAGMTTAQPGDYTIATASPLTFNPGQTSQTVQINLVDDGVADAGKRVVLDLGMPTNAGLGTTKSYALTIQDDDQTCVGQGTYAVCVQKPSATVNLTGTLDTGADPRCTTPFSGWTGQPNSCFIVGTQVTIGSLDVSGNKPLVVIASDTLTVTGTLDVAARAGKPAPGAPFGACGGTPGGGDPNGGGGGAGGSFRSAGGAGGSGNGGGGGGAGGTVPAPTVLRAGCPGRMGGNGGAGHNPGAAGAAGGAVYLAAINGLTLMSGSIINASGSGAAASNNANSSGGSGGGSGGMIKLEGATITATGAIVMSNGGGGASGTSSMNSGNLGSDPSTATPTTQASGGAQAGQAGAGGNGYAGGLQATGGQSVSGNKNPGGGGGAGGGGEVQSSAALTGATVSTGP